MNADFVHQLCAAIADGDLERIKALGIMAGAEAGESPCPCDRGLVFYRDSQARSHVGGCYAKCNPGAVPFGAPLCDPATGLVIEYTYTPPREP